jgi:hypothetical protein
MRLLEVEDLLDVVVPVGAVSMRSFSSSADTIFIASRTAMAVLTLATLTE